MLRSLKFLVALGVTAVSILVVAVTPSTGQLSRRGPDLSRQEQQLLEQFVNGALRLAVQYESQGNFDAAKRVLSTLLKVVPEEKRAREILSRIERQELSQNRVTVRVLANKDWQDTGLVVFAGRPVSFEAEGEWVFRMSRVVGPEGMQIPEEWRKFPLGSLIGIVQPLGGAVAAGPPAKAKKGQEQAPKPFLVGKKKVYIPEQTGVLFLRMHDTEASDNAGQIVVTISGYVRRP